MSKPKGKETILFFVIFAVGIAIRVLYILPPVTVDGDAAVFGLMAKRISEFKEFPIYMWSAHYAGTLSSYIGAVLFRLFGISSFIYNCVGVFFSCLWAFYTYILAKRVLDYHGYLASAIVVLFPPSYVLSLSLFTGGTQSETLLFSSILFLLLVGWNNDKYHNVKGFFLFLGFLSGFGLWLSPGILPCLFTLITVLLLKDRKCLFQYIYLFIIGFLIGYSPGIAYNIQYPGAAFYRFSGRILHLDRSVLSSPNLTKIIVERVLWRISTIPGSLAAIPPMFLSLAGLPNLLIFVAAIFWSYKKKAFFSLQNRKIENMNIFMIYVICFIIFYATFVGERTARYILPLYIVFPIFIGKLLSDIKARSTLLYVMVLCTILSYNGYNLSQSLLNKKACHYPQLAEWLLSKNFAFGYSDYWTAYPLIFESKEQVIISPTLFHPTFSDRKLEYTAKVRSEGNTVYIVRQDMYPQAVTEMEKRLGKLGINYKKDIFEEFVVYNNFSRKIYPEELNLTTLVQ